MQTGKPVFKSDKLAGAAWTHATAAAEKWNQPGVFTTLHGFEWTSAPGGNNLHRTVIFRDGADRVNQVLPFSAFDSSDPARALEVHGRVREEDRRPGARHPAQRQPEQRPDVLSARPSTASPWTGPTPRRAPATSRSSRRRRSRATARPPLSLAERRVRRFRALVDVDFGKMEPAQNSVLHGNYVRSALKLGLELDAKLGANPYQVRPDRRQRCPCRRGHHAGRQLLR